MGDVKKYKKNVKYAKGSSLGVENETLSTSKNSIKAKEYPILKQKFV